MYQLCLIKHYCQHQTGEQNTCIKCVLLTWKLPAVSFSLCFTLLFPLIIYSIRWLETLGPFVDKLFSSLLSFGLIWSQFFKQTQIQRSTYSIYKHSLFENTERQTCTLAQTHKAPFRTRAYTDIKGPLFSPSYRYSTGGLCCAHIYVYATVCLWARVCVKPQCMGWTLADTPRTQSR